MITTGTHFYKPQQWAYFVCICLLVRLDLLWVVLIQFVQIGTFQHPDTAFELLVIPNIYDLATKLQRFCFCNGFYLAFSREETSHHNLRLFRNVVCREWEFVSSFGGKFRREFCILLREKSRAAKVYLEFIDNRKKKLFKCLFLNLTHYCFSWKSSRVWAAWAFTDNSVVPDQFLGFSKLAVQVTDNTDVLLQKSAIS